MQPLCPKCHSEAFKRNGYTRHGKQNYRCLNCGRQFCLIAPADTKPTPLLEVMIERVSVQNLWNNQNKIQNNQWAWIAIEAKAQQVLAFHIERQNMEGIKEIWELLPENYRLHAIIYTDMEEVFKTIIPIAQHHRIRPLQGTRLS